MKKILILLILPFSFMLKAQHAIDNGIIMTVIYHEFPDTQIDTTYDHNGKIKTINKTVQPKIRVINKTTILKAKPAQNYFIKLGFKKIDSSMIINYYSNNEHPVSIDTLSHFKYFVSEMNPDEFNSILQNYGWDGYHKLFGYQPLLKVSRPGLNKEKNKAILFVSIVVNKQSPVNNYYYLEKKENIWSVRKVISSK